MSSNAKHHQYQCNQVDPHCRLINLEGLDEALFPKKTFKKHSRTLSILFFCGLSTGHDTISCIKGIPNSFSCRIYSVIQACGMLRKGDTFFPLRPFSIAVALPARAERALKSAHAGVTGVHNNERSARAGKANVNGKRP